MENEINYIDLRQVPNEVIIGAYNAAVNYFTAYEIKIGSDELDVFKTIIDPNFNKKMEMKKHAIESEAKDKLYSLHLSHPATQETLNLAKNILNERAEALLEIDELKSAQHCFMDFIQKIESEIDKEREEFLNGIPTIISVDDTIVEDYFALVLSKGSLAVTHIETGADDGKTHPTVDGFVAYNDYEHKDIMNKLIESLYANQAETSAENE